SCCVMLMAESVFGTGSMNPWHRPFYRPLSVRVALTGLEIWSDQDKIRVDKSPSDTLNRFLEWRTRELLPRLRHDNAQLIMGESFDGTTVGMASQSSMCSKDRSGGVNVDHLVSVLGVASTIAHELGHNLGMNHDTADRRCQCQNEPRLGGCIMEPSTGFMPGQLFSSCSARDLSLSLLHGGGMCLFNVPQPEKLLGGPRCGNLYVEKGEECDCGLLDECNDPCCNATTCKLVPGAQCSSDGICCDNCKLRTGGWMCRQPLGECDLPEHCTGASPYCPPNVFLQNGEPCEEGSSYCYSGVCASFNTQCQMLWGPNSTRAPSVCFSSVNKQGNKYGNCGQMPNGTYIPCPSKDVHCGRLQCQGGNDRPLLGTSAEILTTKVKFNYSDFVCRGTYFHLGDDVSDPAMVAQGTACGFGKACWNQQCQDVSLFGVEDCQSKCNGHGVCNSNKNCHCDVGWAPPDCRSTGHGGSVESMVLGLRSSVCVCVCVSVCVCVCVCERENRRNTPDNRLILDPRDKLLQHKYWRLRREGLGDTVARSDDTPDRAKQTGYNPTHFAKAQPPHH
uniref:ADAM metallopeptidase domain 15 n=1 Tax=Oncorhynchus kisutch TaxID=8019 RepID=A0A8C7GD05_ONCKI